MHQTILKKVSSKILSSATVFNIDNNKCFMSQQVRVSQNISISKGSCDTEDWHNDVEITALNNKNKLHFKIYSNRKPSNRKYFTILLLLLYFFYQINAALVSIRGFFQKQF